MWKFPNLPPINKYRIIRCLRNCHLEFRKAEGESTVSLRDIRRFMIILDWFMNLFKDVFKTFRTEAIIYFSICTSLHICYILRTSDKYLRPKLLELFKISLKGSSTNNDFYYAWGNFTKKVFDELAENDPDFKKDIAIIEPLKENLISMLVCFCNQIPIVICGKPGTSKTLSTEVLRKKIGYGDKEKGILGKLPKMDNHYYCGSQNSTSYEIEKIFKDTENHMKDLIDYEQGNNPNISNFGYNSDMGSQYISGSHFYDTQQSTDYSQEGHFEGQQGYYYNNEAGDYYKQDQQHQSGYYDYYAYNQYQQNMHQPPQQYENGYYEYYQNQYQQNTQISNQRHQDNQSNNTKGSTKRNPQQSYNSQSESKTDNKLIQENHHNQFYNEIQCALIFDE